MFMTKSFKISTIVIIAFVLMLAVTTKVTLANPYFFGIQTSTATATTTVASIAPGTATTTLVFDSFANGQQFAGDFATLLLQSTGSSTAAVVNVNFQYSQDNVDWYYYNPLFGTATTSVNISSALTYSFTPASTSLQKNAIGTPIPTRYVRAVITASGTSSTVWASFIAKKQLGNNQ